MQLFRLESRLRRFGTENRLKAGLQRRVLEKLLDDHPRSRTS
jgi:hypothetical protein